ncbi:hypothetical protein BV898_18746 [Hypsibius exemplaris]|uniref:PiggyBac transposable element-derived protein domain-containing protein n=1 Tax=Hypsibius exemplaris TaxID=2072580 RepID=A0A9X6NKI9_HYPEX|nr:hypothetical protein BV898_18746 [Hypsibius exemplaris]
MGDMLRPHPVRVHFSCKTADFIYRHEKTLDLPSDISNGPSEAACCQDNNNYRGAALSPLCESSNLLPDSLYICEEGGDPSLIHICSDGCQTSVRGNDIWKHVPVDNKTASQLLSETALKRGQSLFSPDKKTKLSMQMNGDLVVSIIGGDLTEKLEFSEAVPRFVAGSAGGKTEAAAQFAVYQALSFKIQMDEHGTMRIQFDADTIKKKPEIIKVYNATKSGVDTMDQLVGTYSVRRKTNRWPMAFFYDMLDICALNAYVIWTELNPEWNKSTFRRRCEFLEELGKELVKPFVESTRSKIPSLSYASKRTIKEIMPVQLHRTGIPIGDWIALFTIDCCLLIVLHRHFKTRKTLFHAPERVPVASRGIHSSDSAIRLVIACSALYVFTMALPITCSILFIANEPPHCSYSITTKTLDLLSGLGTMSLLVNYSAGIFLYCLTWKRSPR